MQSQIGHYPYITINQLQDIEKNNKINNSKRNKSRNSSLTIVAYNFFLNFYVYELFVYLKVLDFK